MTKTNIQCPRLDFTNHPSVSAFAIPCEAYIANRKSEGNCEYGYIATGALLYDSATPPRILLIQRASHDSMPDRWEVPGGGCDAEDRSILYSAAREVWEETGLVISHIGPKTAGEQLFTTRGGKVVCKFHFLVEVERTETGELDVRIDPDEHQAFVWATEAEVRAEKVGDLILNFTTADQLSAVLEGFGLKKQI
ncbi:hypothetical protein FKW77_009996 [Venturia effusa]|uniref:Nudix hydrolase domain-containing protein n=1 Tax=Venturia effusa TaxID=50376 RepID=A0A517KXH5_9PEZI|nr:hypothetical protein FKW77_009996 [Venturia effusa]